MEASKVQVDSKLVTSKPLSFKRKQQLRKQAIFDLVRGKSYGDRVKLRDIQAAAQFSSQAAAQAFVKRMVANGELEEHEIGPNRMHDGVFYVIPSQIRIKQTVPDKMSNTPAPTHTPTLLVGKKESFTLNELTEAAALYAWSNTVHEIDSPELNRHADVKQFISYLESVVDNLGKLG